MEPAIFDGETNERNEMSDQVIYLKLPERTPAPLASTVSNVMIGRQYHVPHDGLGESLHGLCSAQDYCLQYGRIVPPRGDLCFVWDVDQELTEEEPELQAVEGDSITLNTTTDVLSSHFVYTHGGISEPQIIHQETTPQLTTTASFSFTIGTAFAAVRLGLISLVESQRFALLKNGERYTLLNTGDAGPVLYLPDPANNVEVPIPIMEITGGTQTTQHSHDIKLTQSIPAQLDGSDIETLTVLEQYTSYFMQRELPFMQHNIWTPVCAPITWGWSMRVAKHRDDDWCIVRKKLLMPTVGHDGMEMPVWEGNQLGK